MSSIIIITGSIDEVIDPMKRLDHSQLYYEFWKENPENKDEYLVYRNDFPLTLYAGGTKMRIMQYLGSGKTLSAVNLLAQQALEGKEVFANISLVWQNEGKEKKDWACTINTMEDFLSLSDCTVLLDDVSSTISHFQCHESRLIVELSNAGRKRNIDFIVTAQREMQIPKGLRDISSEWIVPVIRVRDMTKWTPDGTGQPIEMIMLHFDGAKNFLYMSKPLRKLDKLFSAYETVQRAVCLKIEEKRNKRKEVFIRRN